jgi:hypothetical protein
MADQALCDAFYEIGNVIQIDVTMPEADWSTLRSAEPHGGRCANAYIGDRYDWFNATQVALSGSIFPDGGVHVFTGVGVKKRSYCGSFSTSKPALALNFSKFNAGAEVVIEALIGTKFLALNNSVQDESFVRQAVGFMAFGLAGLPHSRCNFARIAVNGQPIGLYVNVEPVKQPHIEHNFGNTLGNLYEIEKDEDFDARTVSSGRASFEGFSPFEDSKDFAVAAQAIASGAAGSVVDLAQFTRHFAMEALLRHWDGYNANLNNTYVYNDVVGVQNPSPAEVDFKFVPWGLDQILQRSHDFHLYDKAVLGKHVLQDPRLRHALDNRIIDTAARVFGLASYNANFLPLIDRIEAVLVANGEASAVDHIASVREQLLELANTDWPSALPGIALPDQRSKAGLAATVFADALHMVHLGEQSNDLWHTRTQDGDVWTANVRLPDQKSKAAPALAEFGEWLHMVHLGDSSNTLWHSVFDGNRWSPNVRIPDQKSRATPALASFGGRLHMVHLGDTSNSLWHSVFDGNAWSPNIPIPDQKSKATPALASFGGRLHMVHLGDTSNSFWHSVFDGIAWSPNVKALRKNSPLPPAIAVFAQRLQVLYVGESGYNLWQGWIARALRFRPQFPEASLPSDGASPHTGMAL